MKVLFISLSLCGVLFAQQTHGPLTDQRIMGLAEAGVSQQELIRLVNTTPSVDFILRPDATDAMAKSGVGDEVIRAMASRESQPSGVTAAHGSKPAALLPPDTPTRSYAGKMRVFIDLSNDSWALTGKGQGSTHPQTVEVMKTFGESCPNLLVTNDLNKADYKVEFERESHKTIRRHNKFAAFDKNGDMVYSSSTRELGNAVRGFCSAIQ